jgi:hypothetical protein
MRATAAARGGDPRVRLATERAHDDRRIAAGRGDARAELGAHNIRFSLVGRCSLAVIG